MQLIKLNSVELNSTTINDLPVFKDEFGKIIILPQLWLIHLCNTGLVTRYQRESILGGRQSYDSFEQPNDVWRMTLEPIADQTINVYVHKVFQFLKYIEEESRTHRIKNLSVHNTELVTTRFLNHYFNNILPQHIKSVSSLELNRSAIVAYFDFLSYMELIPKIESTIYRKTRSRINSTDDRQIKIRYISREIRNRLLMSCESMRDRLILRVGFEVGLRTEECTGLRLTDTIAKGQKHPGINDLINQMDDHPNLKQFKYMLSGLYTKGGKSRYIYFDRDLLMSIKNYRDKERALFIGDAINTDCLFVRTDNGAFGKAISKHHASKTFRKVKIKTEGANPANSYHDLRHTFATELYHSEQIDERGYETRSENTALIKVQQRLGHSSIKSTLIYVHLRQQLIAHEECSHDL